MTDATELVHNDGWFRRIEAKIKEQSHEMEVVDEKSQYASSTLPIDYYDILMGIHIEQHVIDLLRDELGFKLGDLSEAKDRIAQLEGWQKDGTGDVVMKATLLLEQSGTLLSPASLSVCSADGNGRAETLMKKLEAVSSARERDHTELLASLTTNAELERQLMEANAR